MYCRKIGVRSNLGYFFRSCFVSLCLQQILKGLLHIVYRILPGICFSKFKSCVTQEDFFLGTLTVRETITYSAHLRLSRKMTKDEIYSIVKHNN
jgi:hypothetical protein